MMLVHIDESQLMSTRNMIGTYLVHGWLHLFMVQVEVQVDALFRFIGTCLYGISHSDSVTVVPSFYFYFRVARRGKDRWLYPPSGCSWRTLRVVASFWLQPKNWGVGASLRLQPAKLGGWSLLVAARKQRKMLLPMNVILQDI